MPCYVVRTTSVKFVAASSNRLLQALDFLGFKPAIRGNMFSIRDSRSGNSILFDLDKELVTYSGLGGQGIVNKVKREYTRLTLQEVAKRKRWALRSLGNNKFQMVR